MRIARRYLVLVALAGSCAGAWAAGDPVAGERKAKVCVACHGVGGRSTTETIPKLSGQLPGYIVRAVVEFQSGIRSDPTMSGMSGLLANPQDLEDIAAYFGSQPPMKGEAGGAAATARGEELFTRGRCSYCHGDGGKRFAPFLPVVPVIGGQHEAYLVKAIKDIRDGKRPGDAYEMMKQTVSEMSEAEIEAIAQYLSGL